MSQLPKGWATATIEELAGLGGLITDGDWIESKDQDPDGGVRLIQLADVGDGEFRDRSRRFITNETCERLRCTLLQPGDLLIARMPDPLGRACIFPGLNQPAITAVDVLIWRGTKNGPSGRWLMHHLNSPSARKTISSQAGGTTRQRIAGGRLKRVNILVPPLAEQRRIVVKVDSLSDKSARARDHLDHIPRLVEKYKQAILAAAFRGELTSSWRSQNRVSIDIEATRRERAITMLDKRREKALAELPGRGGFEHPIPSTWRWVTIEELASDESRSIQSGPFGSALLHSEFVPQGRLVVGIDNVQDGYFAKGSQNRITDSKFSELIRFAARPKDVLITVMATIGRVCVLPADLEEAIITKHVYRITVDVRCALPEFVAFGLRGSEAALSHMGANVRGQTRPGLNGDIIKRLFLPVPPLREQAEIVRRIESAFNWIDRLANEATSARKLVDHLDQAVLSKAFRGELLPQDSNDEPASVLLERIKLERVAKRKRSKAAST